MKSYSILVSLCLLFATVAQAVNMTFRNRTVSPLQITLGYQDSDNTLIKKTIQPSKSSSAVPSEKLVRASAQYLKGEFTSEAIFKNLLARNYDIYFKIIDGLSKNHNHKNLLITFERKLGFLYEVGFEVDILYI